MGSHKYIVDSCSMAKTICKHSEQYCIYQIRWGFQLVCVYPGSRSVYRDFNRSSGSLCIITSQQPLALYTHPTVLTEGLQTCHGVFNSNTKWMLPLVLLFSKISPLLCVYTFIKYSIKIYFYLIDTNFVI